MRHIMMTQLLIDEACNKFRTQLSNTTTGKDSISITIPTTMTLKPEDRPQVLVSLVAHRKMCALIKQALGEIAWHGTVVYDETTNTYIIEDIFVFPQEVTASTASGTDEYGLWLMSLPIETFNKLRFHGHSHVNMAVFASGVDSAHQDDIVKEMDDFYIFAIYNKRHEYVIWIYDKMHNLAYETKDIDYDIEIDEDEAWASAMISQQVKTHAVVPVTYTTNPVATTPAKTVVPDTVKVNGKVIDITGKGAPTPDTKADTKKPKADTKKTKAHESEYRKYQRERMMDRKYRDMYIENMMSQGYTRSESERYYDEGAY